MLGHGTHTRAAALVVVVCLISAAPHAMARRRGPSAEALRRIRARIQARTLLLPWTDFEERVYLTGEPIVLCAGFGDETGTKRVPPPNDRAYLLAKLMGSGPSQTIPLRDDGSGADLRGADGIYCASLSGLVRPGKYRVILIARDAPRYEDRTLQFEISRDHWFEVHHPREGEKVVNDRPILVEVMFRGRRVSKEQIRMEATLIGPTGMERPLPMQPSHFPGLFFGQIEGKPRPGVWRVRFEVNGVRGRGAKYSTKAVHHFEVIPGAAKASVEEPKPEDDEAKKDEEEDDDLTKWLLVLLNTLTLGFALSALVTFVYFRNSGAQYTATLVADELRELLPEAMEGQPKGSGLLQALPTDELLDAIREVVRAEVSDISVLAPGRAGDEQLLDAVLGVGAVPPDEIVGLDDDDIDSLFDGDLDDDIDEPSWEDPSGIEQRGPGPSDDDEALLKELLAA